MMDNSSVIRFKELNQQLYEKCNSRPNAPAQAVGILKTIELKTYMDILTIDIVDFNRLNGYWNNTAESLEAVSYWLTANGKGGFFASWIRPEDWRRYSRTDFPDWKHAGNHKQIAEEYWNWFMNTDDKDCADRYIVFSDSPDFYGEIQGHRFWGDIGKVSPVALIQSVKNMRQGDLWISLIGDGSIHIVLESRYSPIDCH